jgi:hypothetical protein
MNRNELLGFMRARNIFSSIITITFQRTSIGLPVKIPVSLSDEIKSVHYENCLMCLQNC